MPKTDRHSIKVTVGCQCYKCFQSHKAMDEMVPAMIGIGKALHKSLILTALH